MTTCTCHAGPHQTKSRAQLLHWANSYHAKSPTGLTYLKSDPMLHPKVARDFFDRFTDTTGQGKLVFTHQFYFSRDLWHFYDLLQFLTAAVTRLPDRG